MLIKREAQHPCMNILLYTCQALKLGRSCHHQAFFSPQGLLFAVPPGGGSHPGSGESASLALASESTRSEPDPIPECTLRSGVTWLQIAECLNKIDFVTKCIPLQKKVIVLVETADLFIRDVVSLKHSHVPLIRCVYLLPLVLPRQMFLLPCVKPRADVGTGRGSVTGRLVRSPLPDQDHLPCGGVSGRARLTVRVGHCRHCGLCTLYKRKPFPSFPQ